MVNPTRARYTQRYTFVSVGCLDQLAPKPAGGVMDYPSKAKPTSGCSFLT